MGGVTSGVIYDKITEANAALQGWTGIGVSGVTDALQTEQIKRFEVAYGSARLAADLIGIVITDGFNVTQAGLSVQRFGAEFQTYVQFIKDHLAISQYYIKMLHPWFWITTPQFDEGATEHGTPVNYWNISNPRFT